MVQMFISDIIRRYRFIFTSNWQDVSGKKAQAATTINLIFTQQLNTFIQVN